MSRLRNRLAMNKKAVTELGEFTISEINKISEFVNLVKSYKNILMDAANRSSNLEDPDDIDLMELLYGEKGIVRGYEIGLEMETTDEFGNKKI